MNHQADALRREIEQKLLWRQELVLIGYSRDSYILTALDSELADMQQQLEYWEEEEKDDEQI